MDGMPTCACGCGKVLQRRGRTGPPPMYAGTACRMRAMRYRRLSDEMTPLPGVIKDAPVHVAGATGDLQVQRAVLETRAIAYAMLRLGVSARPELAWRCTRTGEVTLAALDEFFGRTNE